MKILVLNGSPKGNSSNTLKLTKAFCEGISESTPIELEILNVQKMNIKDCTGCFGCWSKTPGACFIKDDMEDIIQKILCSDIIIWSFPLYYYSLPSRIKAVMDRQLPMLLPFMVEDSPSGGHPSRYDMSGKRYLAISTCGFYTSVGNYNAVDEQFSRMYGIDGFTSLYCGEGELFGVPQLQKRTDEYLEFVKQAGREYILGGITPKTNECLAQLLYPKEAFEQMADANWGIKAGESYNDTQREEVSLNFTKQMSALYNKASWSGKDVVLEFYYTDVDKKYQLLLKQDEQKVLTEDFLPYTTRIETPLSVWKSISIGEIDGKQAMMEHLYKVKGDFNLMLHWDDYFGYTPSPKSIEKEAIKGKEKKSNMTLMLLPWIIIWVVLSIDPFVGGIIGIVSATVLPMTFLKWKPTVFEYISVFAVSIISLGSVLGYPISILIPLSYLIFGIQWSVTVFQKIPLSAYYSMNDYNGEKALENPLFIQTNRILTACWGLLYIITPIWTYFLLLTPLGYLTGAINSVLPMLLGVFTGWFKNWYPKYYASK